MLSDPWPTDAIKLTGWEKGGYAQYEGVILDYESRSRLSCRNDPSIRIERSEDEADEILIVDSRGRFQWVYEWTVDDVLFLLAHYWQKGVLKDVPVCSKCGVHPVAKKGHYIRGYLCGACEWGEPELVFDCPPPLE